MKPTQLCSSSSRVTTITSPLEKVSSRALSPLQSTRAITLFCLTLAGANLLGMGTGGAFCTGLGALLEGRSSGQPEFCGEMAKPEDFPTEPPLIRR